MGTFAIFNFDGTGNEPEDAQQKVKYGGKQEDDNISNVLKLHLMLGGNLFRQGEQYGHSSQQNIHHCFYYQGVGTYGSWLNRLINQGLALEDCDVSSILRKALRDFDDISKASNSLTLLVTGFSRGAALARRFVSLIDKKTNDSDTRPKVFLCVWDTVASIGLPNLSTDSRPDYDVVFEEGCTLSRLVVQATHMVSLDEKRKAFQPTLMNHEPQRIQEIWFAGAHSDIGGGYFRDGLADLTLSYAMKWLLEMSSPERSDRIPRLNLSIPSDAELNEACPSRLDNKIGRDDLQRNPNPMGKNHQQDRWPIIDWATLDDRVFCVINNDKIDRSFAPLLHWAVPVRIHRDDDYRPKSLANVEHAVWYDFQSGTTAHTGMTHHIESLYTRWNTLKVDEQLTVSIEADLLYNHSGLLVTPGQQYEIQVADDQVWYDKTIDCDADGWDRESEQLGWAEIPIAAAEPFKRVPDAKWFCLCCAIGTDDDSAEAVGKHRIIDIKHKGELTFFANDLKSKNGNNWGSLVISLKRLA